jgi:hypothetical protein
LVKDLPASVPEASEFNKLAVFGGSSKKFDDLTLDSEKLWEATLNTVLKSTLGWEIEETWMTSSIIENGISKSWAFYGSLQ